MTNETAIKKIASISSKNVNFTAKAIRAMVEDNKEVHFLYRIGGVAVEQFSGSSKHGDYVAYRGIFNLLTRDGDKYSSTVLFPPSAITKRLQEAFGHGEAEIGFMVDVNVGSSDKNASGYAYQVEAVPTEDAIKKAARLGEMVFGSKLPALTGPVKTQKKSA